MLTRDDVRAELHTFLQTFGKELQELGDRVRRDVREDLVFFLQGGCDGRSADNGFLRTSSYGGDTASAEKLPQIPHAVASPRGPTFAAVPCGDRSRSPEAWTIPVAGEENAGARAAELLAIEAEVAGDEKATARAAVPTHTESPPSLDKKVEAFKHAESVESIKSLEAFKHVEGVDPHSERLHLPGEVANDSFVHVSSLQTAPSIVYEEADDAALGKKSEISDDKPLAFEPPGSEVQSREGGERPSSLNRAYTARSGNRFQDTMQGLKETVQSAFGGAGLNRQLSLKSRAVEKMMRIQQADQAMSSTTIGNPTDVVASRNLYPSANLTMSWVFSSS